MSEYWLQLEAFRKVKGMVTPLQPTSVCGDFELHGSGLAVFYNSVFCNTFLYIKNV